MSIFTGSRTLSWYLFNVGGGLAILLGAFFVTLRSIDASDLVEQARRGASVDIKLDPKVCQARMFGSLQCDTPYRGRYTRATNAWVMTGRLAGQSTDATTPPYDNAPNEPGAISMFGIPGKFDRNGKLGLNGSENVGTVTLAVPFWERLFFSE